MRVLVTGGAGYIGSHLCLALLEAGRDVVVLDDFSTGHPGALDRVQALAGRSLRVLAGDVSDVALTRRALRGVDRVVHLAASKDVGQSMARPGEYFRNNLGGLTGLLQAMEAAGVRRMLFASSAAVYSPHNAQPLAETAPSVPTSPYGLTKLLGEHLLHRMVTRHGWAATSLRFFNPVGAHLSAHLGEHVRLPGNLVPRIMAVLSGHLPQLVVHGTDYDTPDGTCVRDYVHVLDLVAAQLLALDDLDAAASRVYNVGTGRAVSVRQVIGACAQAAGRPVPTLDGARRAGDLPVAVADCTLIRRELGFEAVSGLDEMVGSAWRWWCQNPWGSAA